MALPIINRQVREFDTLIGVPVTSSSNWSRVCQVSPCGHKTLFCGVVGPSGALGHLKVTQALSVGGTHVDLVIDSGLDAAIDAVPYCVPSGAYLTAASGVFQFVIDSDAIEIGIWAKKASSDTTLRISGSIL